MDSARPDDVAVVATVVSRSLEFVRRYEDMASLSLSKIADRYVSHHDDEARMIREHFDVARV